jgi:Ni/Co efflux regulator RcnB
MKKILCTAAACAVLATSVIAPASAAQRNRHHSDREQYMQNYCGRHNDSDCRDWNNNRGRWDDARYNSWYERHRHDRDFHDYGPADAAATIFGFAAGAAAGAITGTINGATNGSHVAACEARYRSYDRSSDTYMGHDGYRHECRL